MNLGVVVFKSQNRAIFSVIIDLWLMRGVQKLEKGTKGLGRVRCTIKDGLGIVWCDGVGVIRLKREDLQMKIRICTKL